MDEKTVKTQSGKEYNFYKVNRDRNGNPRYVVSWLNLGLKTYAPTAETKKAGLKIYRGADFGGGFVFQSYNIKAEAELFESLGLK
jgi:hypothetical protein